MNSEINEIQFVVVPKIYKYLTSYQLPIMGSTHTGGVGYNVFQRLRHIVDYATHIAASTLAALPYVIVSGIVFDVSIRLPPHPREGRQDKGVVQRREVTMLPLRKLGSG